MKADTSLEWVGMGQYSQFQLNFVLVSTEILMFSVKILTKSMKPLSLTWSSYEFDDDIVYPV